jgi:hypothetical protein
VGRIEEDQVRLTSTPARDEWPYRRDANRSSGSGSVVPM